MARIFVEGNVDIQYVIRLIPFGSLEHTKDVITVTKDDLKQPLELMPRPYDANISIVVKAKGRVLYILGQSINVGLVQKWANL